MNLNQTIGSRTVVDHFGLRPDAGALRRLTVLSDDRSALRSLFAAAGKRDCREIDCSNPCEITRGSFFAGLPVAAIGNRPRQKIRELVLQLRELDAILGTLGAGHTGHDRSKIKI